jgi:hypothetical protein
MNFDVFDFHDEFTLHEVVCLCIGRDPAAGEPAAGDADLTAYAAVKAGAVKSMDFAVRKCAQANIAGAKQSTLPGGQLYPEWVLFYVGHVRARHGSPLAGGSALPARLRLLAARRGDSAAAITIAAGRRPGNEVALGNARDGAASGPQRGGRTLWANFDPTDHTTAPTNEEVIAWLLKRPGVSKSMAERMATILRAEG